MSVQVAKLNWNKCHNSYREEKKKRSGMKEVQQLLQNKGERKSLKHSLEE